MQPEKDESTGTDPSTADLADTGSVAPGSEGHVAEARLLHKKRGPMA
jgi:hypothetical protein